MKISRSTNKPSKAMSYIFLVTILCYSTHSIGSTENPVDDNLGMCVAVNMTTAEKLAPQVIFQNDFSASTGYLVDGSASLWNGGQGNPTPPPQGWDAVKAGGQSKIEVVAGEGLNNTNALKIEWDPNASQPTISLGKHLTGDPTTGYSELYVRYRLRFPNNIRFGDDTKTLNYWKWGRLWQNTNIINDGPNKWTENRENSHYVVWAFSGRPPYTQAMAVWGENEGEGREYGSSGGPRQRVRYFISGSDEHTAAGYFESLWDLDMENVPGTLVDNSNQTWHTIEWRFKLATDENSSDGVFEMWWDGEYQGQWPQIQAFNGAPERPGIPTTTMGSGLNFLVVFDNMSMWNASWNDPNVDGFIWLNDVVVSETRIGHEYLVTE